MKCRCGAIMGIPRKSERFSGTEILEISLGTREGSHDYDVWICPVCNKKISEVKS